MTVRNPQERGVGTVLVEVGAKGRGGRGRGRERGRLGKRKGGEERRDYEQGGQSKDPRATQPDRENEKNMTNRSGGRKCVGVVPPVHSTFSRSLHAHRGDKLPEDLLN